MASSSNHIPSDIWYTVGDETNICVDQTQFTSLKGACTMARLYAKETGTVIVVYKCVPTARYGS